MTVICAVISGLDYGYERMQDTCSSLHNGCVTCIAHRHVELQLKWMEMFHTYGLLHGWVHHVFKGVQHSTPPAQTTQAVNGQEDM